MRRPPNVARVQSLMDELNRQIDDRVNGIITGMENQLESEKASLDALTASVETAKEKDQAEAIRGQPYWNEKRKLENMIEFHKLLAAKIESEKLDVKIPKTSIVEITDPAQPGEYPVKPNKTLNIVLGVIIGLIMGVSLAFFIEYLDTSVKTIEEVERAFQMPVLGVVPQNVGYLLDEGPESQHAEAYRVLRTNILFSRKDEKLNTIVVVSAGAGEGKSITTLNLATVFAQAGERVLVVDSDLRRPTLHKQLHVSNNLGLTNYLLKQNKLEEIIQTTSVPMLDFMASGKLPSSSMSILGSVQMKEMVAELKQRYDFIFFDSPPILGVSDASILASEVDIVIQVIQYRRYPQPMSIRAKQLIEKVGGNLIGILLNNINMSQDESYYYYSGYYHGGYYYSRNEDAQETAARKKIPATPTRLTLNKSIDCAPSFARIRNNEIILESVKFGIICLWPVVYRGHFHGMPLVVESTPSFPPHPTPPIMTGSPVTGYTAAGGSPFSRWRHRHCDLVRPSEDNSPHQEPIKEDGTITMPDIGHVQAAGKTAGELQNEIYNLYVPKLYRHLTVTVIPGDRVYYVTGEVKQPGRQLYVGQMTVTKAITTAGDFTDFANHKVWLIRANGQRIKVNCNKALKDSSKDLQVYPNDQIYVPRRLL